jgi:hypothetical protein
MGFFHFRVLSAVVGSRAPLRRFDKRVGMCKIEKLPCGDG